MSLRFLFVLVTTTMCFGQDAASKLAELLGFEATPSAHIPGGWNGGAADTIWVDSETFHSGSHALRIERKADSANDFSAVNRAFPIDFAGKTIELRGFLRTENVSAYAGLWLRQDGDGSTLSIDNMQSQHLNGTNDWKEYSVRLPLFPNADRLVFGVLMAGTGKVWADDLRLLVDGKPILDAPRLEKPKTVIDEDHEFDAGSRSSLSELTAIQVENLTTLGKVWGFLKYHHPLVTSGKRQWDYELFRVLPAVLDSKDRASANAAIRQWIEKLGPIAACSECAALPEKDIVLRRDLDWLRDEKLLGKELSETLQSIYKNRAKGAKQFYVAFNFGVGNPIFDHELDYKNAPSFDVGFRLLGIYRFWNIVEYWFPYRDITRENWDAVLKDAIPKVTLAKDFVGVQREIMALIARAHDTHANLWSSLSVRPPVGTCLVPVNVRFVENRAIVTSHATASTESPDPAGLQVGDEIKAIGGVKVAQLVSDWDPYYAVSNEAAKLREIGRSLTKGTCGETTLSVHRKGEDLSIKVMRVSAKGLKLETTHDLPGETFRLLSDDVAYLKLSSVKISDAASYVTRAAKTKGLVIDIRNYPSEFVVFALGSLLVDRPTPFAKFSGGDASNPGAFHWLSTIPLEPAQPHYAGKIVILIDEVSQSQAEYTTMAFRSAKGAFVIGSMTAGADGNVSTISLPFGLRSMVSGIGAFYPDGRPTQRVGIVPDLEVKPTVAGIREGRDEVLEAGIRRILGDDVSRATIQSMARH